MSTPAVYKAISDVMAAIGHSGISKARKNQQQGYQFRGIDDVYNELNGHMVKAKLLVLPRVVSSTQTDRQSKGGGSLIYTRLAVEFDFVAVEDGSKHTIATVGEAMDSADKSSNKAMAAAYKYAAMMAFCIPTEGDNDADATTHEVQPVADESANLARRMEASLKVVLSLGDLASWNHDNKANFDLLNDDDFDFVKKLYKTKQAALKPAEQEAA